MGFEIQKERKHATCFGGSFQDQNLDTSPNPSTAAMTKQDSDVMCTSGGTAGSMGNRFAAVSFGKSSSNMGSGVSDLNFLMAPS